MLSNHIILCYPLFLPSNFQTLGPFPVKHLFVSGGQRTGASASASVLPRDIQFSSVQFSCSVMSNSSWTHGPQHSRPPCPSPTPGVYSTHLHWVSEAIKPSHPLPSPSLPAFNLSQHQGLFQEFFTSGGQSIGVSASASVLPMNIQDWFPLGWTGWISLQS